MNSTPPSRPDLPTHWVWTGIPSDIALKGPGYFVLRDTITQEIRLSRTASLRIDSNGNLVTSSGQAVQGLAPRTHQLIDLKIALSDNLPGAYIHNWAWDDLGRCLLKTTDDQEIEAGQIALWQPDPSTRLRRMSEETFVDPNFPADWTQHVVVPDGILRTLVSGYYEPPEPELQILPFDFLKPLNGKIEPLPLGQAYCLFLESRGFLVVRDPRSNQRYVTRCGALKIDMDCWLVTALEGYRVQGWRGPSFTESGDLRIDLSNRPTTSDPASRLGHTAITRDGQLRIRLSDGTDYVHAQIALIAPPAPQHLRHDAQGLYTVDAPDLMDLATKALPRTSILMAEGFLDPRYLTPELRAWIRRSISLNQRPLSLTGVLSHLAISGPGYFILRDAKSNQTYFTRSGYFQWSGDGYLEGIHGWRVQGWDINDDSPRSVDVRTSTHQRPSPTQTIRINWDGQVTEDDGNGKSYSEYEIATAYLPDPTEFVEVEPTHFQLPPDRVWFSEPFDSTPGWLPARSFPAGSIQQGALELFWYSEPFLTEDLPTNGRQLKAFGVQGTSALIQVSSDFQHWANWMMLDDWDNFSPVFSIGNQSPANAVSVGTQIFDSEPPKGSARFYRMILAPRR